MRADKLGGSFRPAFSQLSKLRDQLEPHTRLFGTTATLRPDTWKEIRETAGFHPEIILEYIKRVSIM